MDSLNYDLSLEEMLKGLLRQQETLEERIIAQRATMRDISDRFTVLREQATRSAHGERSLHELLVLAAYGGTTRRAQTFGAKDDEADGPRALYDALIRSRVLDESCAAPDCATQFHSLTADSLYLLIPHLMHLLRELVRESRPLAAAAAFVSTPRSAALGDAAAAERVNAEWVTRVLRFIELGVHYFPEVLENSECLPQLQEGLAQLGNQETVGMELKRRARQLLQQMERRQTDELL